MIASKKCWRFFNRMFHAENLNFLLSTNGSATKTSHTPLRHHQTELLTIRQVLFMMFTPNSHPTICMSQQETRFLTDCKHSFSLPSSSFVHAMHIVFSDSCFCSMGIDPDVAFCCCSFPSSRLVLRCFCAHHSCE